MIVRILPSGGARHRRKCELPRPAEFLYGPESPTLKFDFVGFVARVGRCPESRGEG